MKKIICIMGPTASGKSDLAFDLALKFSGEIINVDSALVYRDMNIGTAKPSSAQLQKIPHHLIDILDPSETYSAAQFFRDAEKNILDIFDRGNLPFLVGGTMLYFRAIQMGLSELPQASPELREKIKAEGQSKGWDFLHSKLSTIDPKSAEKIKPTDTQRIQRALEVYELTGTTLSSLWETTKKSALPYEFINIAITPASREELHLRIAERFKAMCEAGFLQEVAALKARGDLSLDLPSMRACGYRQAWEFLENRYDYLTLIEKANAATRQLAKRQLTWLRHWPTPIKWFDSSDRNLRETVESYLKGIDFV